MEERIKTRLHKTGGDLVKYRVNVEELLSRIVEVEADSDEEAEEKVREMYMNEEIVLDASDFQSVEYFVQ